MSAPANPSLSFEERLRAAPVVDVRGVVSGTGASGGSAGGAVWDLIFHFAAWRVADHPTRGDPQMRLYHRVAKDDLSRWMSEIRPYAVWRVRAAVLDEPVNGQLHGRVIELVGVEPNDAELTAESGRLQAPVTVDDPQLGRLTLDRGFDQFGGEIEWCGNKVRLTLAAAKDAAVPGPTAISVARSLLADQTAWQRRVNEFAAARLLELRNETWRQEGEPNLSEAEFAARMRLQDIAIATDGGFDFWHDDGGLSWGHAIQISGTVADGPTAADTPG